MTANLKGPTAKWERAQGQLDKLQAEVWEVWPPSKAWPVRAEENRGGLEYRFYLGELPTIDPDWVLWAGEILFDLRSTLDHLIYQLHVRRWRGKIPAKVKVAGVKGWVEPEKQGQFPICSSLHAWRSNYFRIATLSERDRRTLQNLQPYVARNDDALGDRLWLGELDLLHGIDKHRRLHAVNGAHGAAMIPGFPPKTGFRMDPQWGPVESGDHVDTWTFTSSPDEMYQHRGAFIAPALEHEGRRSELIPMLREIAACVGRVLLIWELRYPALGRHR